MKAPTAGRSNGEMTVYRLRLALLLLGLLLLAPCTLPVHADADDDLEDLLDEYEMVVRRKDERGWGEQRVVLEKIADINTKQSKRALKMLRNDAGRGDWRRTKLVLAAMARHATPKEIDEVIRWTEVGKDVFLLENMGEILCEAGHVV